MLRRIFKWLLRAGLALVGLVLLYVAYASWAYRDIPVQVLEERYGGDVLRTALVDGLSVRYRMEGSGPVVVLIHSHYFEMGLWDGWVAALTPYFKVLRYDLSGHGFTGPDLTGIYTVDRDISLLVGLLDQLGVQRASFVGSSLGGNIAFGFAARYPERIEKLVLINSGGMRRESSRSGASIPGWADPVLPLVPDAAIRAFLDWMTGENREVQAAYAGRFVDFWRREGNRVAELARLRQFKTGDTDGQLASVTAPTLILWGESNPQLPVALSVEFEKKLTRASRVVCKTYPGAGHVLPLERAEDSAKDTLAFLLAVESAAPAEGTAP